jgi:hypothetical protein
VYVFSTDNIAADDITTFETLSGGMARQSPNTYRIAGNIDGSHFSAFWLKQLELLHKEAGKPLTVDDSFVHDFPGLLTHFKSRISGFVTYDPSANSTSTNAALTYCAASPEKGGAVVVAVASGKTRALLLSLGVPQLRDLTAVSFRQIYQEIQTQGGTLLLPITGGGTQCGSKAQAAKAGRADGGCCGGCAANCNGHCGKDDCSCIKGAKCAGGPCKGGDFYSLTPPAPTPPPAPPAPTPIMKGFALNMRMVAFNPPSKAQSLAAYSVFGRMPTLEYPTDGTVA